MTDTTIKSKVLNAVEDMPPNVNFHALMERLYFLFKVERGLQQVAAGDIISHERLKKQIKTWHE